MLRIDGFASSSRGEGNCGENRGVSIVENAAAIASPAMRDVGPSNESPAVRDRLQVLAEMRRSKVELRDYQKECLEAIEAAGDGRHLVHLATGLGKTVVFTHMERHGRVLLLS